MNTITIALCEEDRKLLEGLMGSISLLASVTANAQPKEVQEKIIAEAHTMLLAMKPAAPDAGHPADEVSPHGEPEPVAEAKYTQADILAVVQRLIAPGSTKRAEAKAIVNDYATKISAIPADKYNEVMDRLNKLEKEV